MLKLKYQNGFTLIELLIALVLNVILFSALIIIFVSNVNHYKKTLNANRLNQQLESAMQLMSSEIRRAGYWANAYTDIGTHQNNNPFMTNTTNIQVNAANDCILFAYDQDKNGTLPSISGSVDDERYGFRLSGQNLQSRPPGAGFSCTAAATNWENVTDTNVVRITQLIFTLNTQSMVTGPGTKGIVIRNATITITGQLANDATISKTLSQTVRIRNDKFIP